jgi:hypothetical protein
MTRRTVNGMGLLSAPLNWQAKAFQMSFLGQIPVWDSAQTLVGYRKSYDDNTVIFNASYKGQSPLYSLTWAQDVVQLNVGANSSATAANTGTGTATPTVVYTPSPVAVGTQNGTLVSGTTGNAALDKVLQYKVPIIIGLGSIALLWLFLGSRK